MSLRNAETPGRSAALGRRLAGLCAGTAALVIGITGLVIPGANALNNGEWTHDIGFGVGSLEKAYGTAVDPANGDVYVTDFVNNKLLKFDRNGKQIGERGGLGNGLGNFENPRGIVVGEKYLFVADTGNAIVQRFTKDLGVAGQIGMVDAPGAANGQFNVPQDVALDGEGNIYVADTANNRVQKFGSDLSWKDTWGTAGAGEQELSAPRGVAVLANGRVLVADSGNNRLSWWTNDGTHLQNYGATGSGPGQFDMPGDIAVDGSGNILVADWNNDRIQQFDELASKLITSWSVNSDARDVAYDPVTSRAYVAGGNDGMHSYRRAAAPSIASTPATWTTAGKWYWAPMKATGFPTTMNWSMTAGSLPHGLKLSGGTISGYPTKPGKYSFTISANNGVLIIPAASRSYTVSVGKASSKVSAKFSTKYPRVARTNIRATIKLSAPYTKGLSKTGKVRVYYGKKRVKTYTVRTSNKGVIKVRLPKFAKKGKTKVTLKYLGNSQLKSAKRTIYVRVR